MKALTIYPNFKFILNSNQTFIDTFFKKIIEEVFSQKNPTNPATLCNVGHLAKLLIFMLEKKAYIIQSYFLRYNLPYYLVEYLDYPAVFDLVSGICSFGSPHLKLTPDIADRFWGYFKETNFLTELAMLMYEGTPLPASKRGEGYKTVYLGDFSKMIMGAEDDYTLANYEFLVEKKSGFVLAEERHKVSKDVDRIFKHLKGRGNEMLEVETDFLRSPARDHRTTSATKLDDKTSIVDLKKVEMTMDSPDASPTFKMRARPISAFPNNSRKKTSSNQSFGRKKTSPRRTAERERPRKPTVARFTLNQRARSKKMGRRLAETKKNTIFVDSTEVSDVRPFKEFDPDTNSSDDYKPMLPDLNKMTSSNTTSFIVPTPQSRSRRPTLRNLGNNNTNTTTVTGTSAYKERPSIALTGTIKLNPSIRAAHQESKIFKRSSTQQSRRRDRSLNKRSGERLNIPTQISSSKISRMSRSRVSRRSRSGMNASRLNTSKRDLLVNLSAETSKIRSRYYNRKMQMDRANMICNSKGYCFITPADKEKRKELKMKKRRMLRQPYVISSVVKKYNVFNLETLYPIHHKTPLAKTDLDLKIESMSFPGDFKKGEEKSKILAQLFLDLFKQLEVIEIRKFRGLAPAHLQTKKGDGLSVYYYMVFERSNFKIYKLLLKNFLLRIHLWSEDPESSGVVCGEVVTLIHKLSENEKSRMKIYRRKFLKICSKYIDLIVKLLISNHTIRKNKHFALRSKRTEEYPLSPAKIFLTKIVGFLIRGEKLIDGDYIKRITTPTWDVFINWFIQRAHRFT